MKTTPLLLTLDKDGWTKSLQLSIEDDIGGYRLCGPKYNGSSARLMTHVLKQRDADEIRRYLDRHFPRVAPITAP